MEIASEESLCLSVNAQGMRHEARIESIDTGLAQMFTLTPACTAIVSGITAACVVEAAEQQIRATMNASRIIQSVKADTNTDVRARTNTHTFNDSHAQTQTHTRMQLTYAADTTHPLGSLPECMHVCMCV